MTTVDSPTPPPAPPALSAPPGPFCVREQQRLGFANPLPMWGFHWIEPGTRRHLVRVYDSRTAAERAEFECLFRVPQRYAESWIEPE